RRLHRTHDRRYHLDRDLIGAGVRFGLLSSALPASREKERRQDQREAETKPGECIRGCQSTKSACADSNAESAKADFVLWQERFQPPSANWNAGHHGSVPPTAR